MTMFDVGVRDGMEKVAAFKKLNPLQKGTAFGQKVFKKPLAPAGGKKTKEQILGLVMSGKGITR
jgi:hypothetical protein